MSPVEQPVRDVQPPEPNFATVLIAGPPRSGKTTLIRTFSELAVADTRSVPSGGDGQVVVDFGRASLADGLYIDLVGLPWGRAERPLAAVVERRVGALVLVDDQRPFTYMETAASIESLGGGLTLPLVVAVNHIRRAPDRAVGSARHELRLPHEIPVVPVDARQEPSVRAAVGAVLRHALEHSASKVTG